MNMGLMTDREIQEIGEKMINPFVPHSVKEQNGNSVISFGLSSAGYDIRLANEFCIFNKVIIDPKLISRCFDEYYQRVFSDFYVIPPASCVLGLSVEEFNMPENVMGLCVGKSTYARCGIFPNITPLEPGWKGHLVIEVANLSGYPVKVYANEGIAQIIFFKLSEPCSKSYKDKGGKYQNQEDFQIIV